MRLNKVLLRKAGNVWKLIYLPISVGELRSFVKDMICDLFFGFGQSGTETGYPPCT
jgi:hypothetical protein